MIVALHSVLHEGAEEEYDRDHQRIPDDLAELFVRIGIRDWSIWRSGRDLFHLVDCDDWSAANVALRDHPANLAWQRHIGRHVAYFAGQDGGPEGQVLPLVYTFAEQLAATKPKR